MNIPLLLAMGGGVALLMSSAFHTKGAPHLLVAAKKGAPHLVIAPKSAPPLLVAPPRHRPRKKVREEAEAVAGKSDISDIADISDASETSEARQLEAAYQAWGFAKSDLKLEDVRAAIQDRRITRVQYDDGLSRQVFIRPGVKPEKLSPKEPTLFVSNDRAAGDIANRRLERMDFSNKGGAVSREKDRALNAGAYEVGGFRPGTKKDRKQRIDIPASVEHAVAGPDFELSDIDSGDPQALEDVRSRVLSLGNGGEITLKVSNGGALLNQAGPDFAVYENVFRTFDGKLFQEFARVGVAERDEAGAYLWFPCKPPKVIMGCAGVVPTGEGGDRFDLSQVGLSQARFIKIRDVGINSNIGSGSEGFDLDALELMHVTPR